MKHLLLFTCLILSVNTVADHHSAAGPVETWQCSLNEGKTMSDVRMVSKAVGEWSANKGLQDAQWIFTPFSGDMSDSGRFILMTAWSDFEGMGQALQGFFGDGEGADIFAAFNAAATCDTRNFWTVETVFDRLPSE